MQDYTSPKPPSSVAPRQVDAPALLQIARLLCATDAELAALGTPEWLATLLPETLCALKIVARSRLKNPSPAPVYISPDLSETPADL